MKKSRNMSRIQRTTSIPFLPTLPIEVWFITWQIFTWSLVEEGADYIFQFQFRDKHPDEAKRFRGIEYVNALLAIDRPQQLVDFLNTYACPIFVQDPDTGERHRTAAPYSLSKFLGVQAEDPVTGEWHATTVPDWLEKKFSKGRLEVEEAPFHWSAFVEAQTKPMRAMRVPIPNLLRSAELKSFFNLDKLSVTAERRNGSYYGTVTMSPSLDACYRVIAVERLLANVEYGFCERCGKPFRVTSKHERKYCDTSLCGHAVAQQAYRDKKRKELKEKMIVSSFHKNSKIGAAQTRSNR